MTGWLVQSVSQNLTEIQFTIALDFAKVFLEWVIHKHMLWNQNTLKKL